MSTFLFVLVPIAVTSYDYVSQLLDVFEKSNVMVMALDTEWIGTDHNIGVIRSMMRHCSLGVHKLLWYLIL